MKTKLTLLALLISIFAISQNGINYKAVVKDSNGNVISNSNIDVQISIMLIALPIYVETHNVDTNANGLIMLNIGEGTVVEGAFESIDWKNDRPDLNVQVDIGNGYVDLGSTPFKAVPYAIRALQQEGLEEVFEGGNGGLRISNVNPDHYGDIGISAIDLSFSDIDSENYGATGNYATAMGKFTEASGVNSIAMGTNTDASGNYSTALGYLTNASGLYSVAIGFYTEASGNYSTSMGQQTQANSYSSTALGRYNVGGGNEISWNDIDPLFEIGNGTSDSNRNNALTVRKDGTHTIRSNSTGVIVESGSTGILLVSPGSNGLTIFNPSSDGIQIDDAGLNGIDINSPNNNGIEISDASDNGINIISSGTNGINIINAGTNGILVSGSQTYGASFTGNNAGIRVRSTVSQNPDIILRADNNPSNGTEDDGIISSDPNFGSSDFFIRSYDGVIVELDYNDNEAGNFNIRNGDAENVFVVSEAGNVDIEGNIDMLGRLQIGTETIEDTGSDQLSIDASVIPNTDNDFRLGNSSNRWISVYATDGTINTSDRRSKTNIASLNYGIVELMKLNPVSFNWKTNPNDDTKLGLIAQDLLKVIPEVVKTHDWETDEDGNKIKKELERMGVYYSDLVPVLIKAIQEQQDIITNQNTKIDRLSAKLTQVKSMDSRLKQLEALLHKAEN